VPPCLKAGVASMEDEERAVLLSDPSSGKDAAGDDVLPAAWQVPPPAMPEARTLAWFEAAALQVGWCHRRCCGSDVMRRLLAAALGSLPCLQHHACLRLMSC
jgi:hypothetical protein